MKWSRECCWVLWWMTDLKSQIASLSLSIQKMMQTSMKVMIAVLQNFRLKKKKIRLCKTGFFLSTMTKSLYMIRECFYLI